MRSVAIEFLIRARAYDVNQVNVVCIVAGDLNASNFNPQNVGNLWLFKQV